MTATSKKKPGTVRNIRFGKCEPTTVFLSVENRKAMSFARGRNSISDVINHALDCYRKGVVVPPPWEAQKVALPVVDTKWRMRIDMDWSRSRFISALGIRVPEEWYLYLLRESQFANTNISTFVKHTMGKYLSVEDIKAMAVEQDVPYCYLYRGLLPNVFPDLPVCSFGPPGRGNIGNAEERRKKPRKEP